MAQITQTAKGFNLSDTIKLKGENLTCEFSIWMTGEAGGDPKAAYWEKFRAYFAQDAAATWNKASVKAQKKLGSKFGDADKEFGKFVAKVHKYNIKDPDQTIKAEEEKYSNKLFQEFDKLVKADIGPSFMESAHTAAEKRMQKEGTKLKKSKAKTAFKVGKVIVKVAAVAAAAIAAAATGGAGAPLLVAVAGWVAFSMSTSKKLLEGGKIFVSLVNDASNDRKQMEKKLAELDSKFADAVKFANRLESKADLMEMEAGKLRKTLDDTVKSLADVNPASKKHAAGAKALMKQARQVDQMLGEAKGSRVYAQALRKSFTAFRKVQNNASWGTNIEKAKPIASFLNDIGKGLETLAKAVSTTSA